MNEAMPDSPQFAILGAGALGTIFGAHLARAGHGVVMLVRERRAQQIRKDGLCIKGLDEFSIAVPVLTDASQLRSAGALIVAMKTLGTASALAPLRGADVGTAFSLQNGAFKNDQLIAVFGKDRVLGALADTSGELLPSGEVLFTRNVSTLVGELAGGLSERAQAIATTIDQAGVRTGAAPDIVSREWSKFCGWAGYMTMSVVMRVVTWKYQTDPDAALIVARIVREVGTLARARGVELTDQSILPIASMCSGTESDAAAAVVRAGEHLKNVAPQHKVSSLQDLEAGRPLEVEETIGQALREARQYGLSMPVLESLYHLALCTERIVKK
jgi:2-dehydropantoate 2-reductase